MVVVIMGVSGSGKTTIGLRLAEVLGGTFAEGDAYHPPENIEKMKSGTPLTDADRWPWLDRLSTEIGKWLAEGRAVILACSALKQSYRDRLAAGREGVHFVYLKGTEDLIRARLELRTDHYMPASLLGSQLAALEEPIDAVTLDVSGTPEDIVAVAKQALQRLAD
jgi:gluconokinase